MKVPDGTPGTKDELYNNRRHQSENISRSSNGTRSRGGRSRKKGYVGGGGSSIANNSDAGSLNSAMSNSPGGHEGSKDEGSNYNDSNNPYENKKRNGRRRRNAKLRNKVDPVQSNRNKDCSRNSSGNGSHSSSKDARPKYTFGWNTTVCPASKGGPTSKKQHDAPMMKRDLYFSLHCQRVAISSKSNTIQDEHSNGGASSKSGSPGTPPSSSSDAVGRVTLINWENEVVLDTYVQVPVPVTDFYDTGIKPENVAADSQNAKSFATVRQIVESRLKGKILVGHEVEKHLSALGLTHPWTDTRDCVSFFKQNNGSDATVPSLESLCKERLQRSLPPPSHTERPMQSCIASLDLYKKFRKEWEEFLIAEARKRDVEQEKQASHSRRQRTYSYESYDSIDHAPPMPRDRLGSTDILNPNIVALHCSIVKTANDMMSLARVTVLNSFHQVLWDTFVHVREPIVDFGDSGVFPHDVKAVNGAVSFTTVRQHVDVLLRGKVVVGYKLDESLGLLGLSFPSFQLRDIAYFRPFMYAEMDGVSGTTVIVERGLDELCFEVLQKPLAPPGHRNRPLASCSIALELYGLYQDRWEKEIQQQQQNQYVPRGDGYPQHHHQNKNGNSWFSWGKRQQPSSRSAHYQPQVHHPHGPGAVPSTTLSSQAFHALHGGSSPSINNVPKGENSQYGGSSYVTGTSFQENSSHYEPSLRSRLDDSSRGIVEALTADSVISSIHDDASSLGQDGTCKDDTNGSSSAKGSSWFRFGSRKSRYNSPSSRVSMKAVQEQVDDPPEMSLTPSALLATMNGANEIPSDPTDSQASEYHTPSRSWFGFTRRSTSPDRMTNNNSHHITSRSRSPESPLSGPSATTVSELESPIVAHEVGAAASVNAIELALSASTANQIISPLGGSPEATEIVEQQGGSNSWFGFRRSKSQRNASEHSDDPSESLQQLDSVSELASESDVALTTTEKTDGTDDDWLQEVMSQSTGTGANDDLNSIGFASLLESEPGGEDAEDAKIGKSSRGQSSWFGFKRSKSRKSSRLEAVADGPEESESNDDVSQLPDLVSVDKTKSASRQTDGISLSMKSSQLGVSWYLGSNSAIAPQRDSPDGSILSRSRLPTESTVPTVSTEEEDDSAGAFTEEFEKGVAQSFAYLEI